MPYSISGSVGEGGVNRTEDVRTVYALFNKILPAPLAVSDTCSAQLVQAIKTFQTAFMSRPDGRIDVGGGTWRRLTAAAEPSTSGGDAGTGSVNLNGAWAVRNQWSDSYEAEFSRWVEQLYAKKGATLTACLRNPAANSLYSDEDRTLSVFSDCADLPYLLRAYFAYKKKLPFSFNSTISGGRYTSGNLPGSRKSFLDYASFSSLARAVSNSVHSGFFRYAWTTEKTDTYLAEVSRESVTPGTVYYDANGHVLVVGRVDADGTVWMMDGHPDNSLTSKRFGESLSRGSCKSGGGFRRWRRQTVSGSSIVLAANQAEKFFDSGQSQCQSNYRVDGFDLNYHQWVKKRLASSGSRIDPVTELGQQLSALHEALKERVDSVKAAVDNGIHRKTHPGSLPRNIYGAEGEWETYSTPGRDARLRAQVKETHSFISMSVEAVARGSHPYLFSGTASQLVRRYAEIWQDSSARLRISYTSSAGAAVLLTLAEIMDRLFKLSFDPYHCPELRWGDTQSTACQDGSVKRDWYNKEQRLRNVITPDSSANTTVDWGPLNPPDIHIGQLIERLKQQYGV
ncbi:hypothetical protein [Candidatus Electronema sp. JC]|uniref:hypothetical protein n=1 Tax=Candidatus Electronema sp. JC TaxID=3401570 RepID=UPI003B438C17